MKVTFDASTWASALTPEQCGGEHNHSACLVVHEALRSHCVRGYFSEAVVTLDALGRDEKVDIVGGAYIGCEATPAGSSLGWRWKWTQPTDQRFLDRINAARILDVRALVGPRRLGASLPVRGFGDDFYESESTPTDFIVRAEKIHEVDRALAARRLGRASAVNLGLKYSARVSKEGELFAKGLGRARDKKEGKKVWQAINEWADGEAIAAHVGYGNDFFCTHDFGGGLGPSAVFHPVHRNWLATRYGVQFVTLPELAALL